MDKEEKRDLFVHWLAYQCAKDLFKQKLTISEIKGLYHIIGQSKMGDIQERTGKQIKSIKAVRTFLYRKIKAKHFDKSRVGKDNIFYYLIFSVMFGIFTDDFFHKWKKEFNRKVGKKDPENSLFHEAPIKELPVGVKSFKDI